MFTFITDRQADSIHYAKYEEPELHVAALLDASICTLDLNNRILYPLADYGVKTIRDLLQHLRRRPRGLKSIPNVGDLAISAIEHALLMGDLLHLDCTA